LVIGILSPDNQSTPHPRQARNMRHQGKFSVFSVCMAFLLLGGCSPAEPDAGLQAGIDELQAQEAIRSLFTDYGRTLDERDFDAFGRLFARDGAYVAGGAAGTAEGPEAIAALLEELITSNATGANLHTFANEKITFTGSDSATAISRGAFYVQDAAGQPQLLM